MRTMGMIAGSLGVTLILGVVGLMTLGASAALFLLSPPTGDPNELRQAVVDQGDELAWCAQGTSGGALTLTLVTRRGEISHVGIDDADVSEDVAQCVADSILALSMPQSTASARFVVRLQPPRVPPR